MIDFDCWWRRILYKIYTLSVVISSRTVNNIYNRTSWLYSIWFDVNNAVNSQQVPIDLVRTRCEVSLWLSVNSYPPGQNGRHFADDIFKRIFLNEKVWIVIKSSLKFVPKGPIGNDKALV